MRRGFISTLLALIIFSPTIVAAQFGAAEQSFTVSVNPATPRSHSSVTLTPIGGQIDLANAVMAVSVRGAQVYMGNAQPVQITVGEAGRAVPVVVAMTSAGKTYTQTLSITPQDIALIAEPISSAPPLYAGKPLVPIAGSVRMVAVVDMRSANGAQLDPLSLGYAWQVDGVQAISASGVGKRVMIADSPLQYRSRTISVMVTSPDGAQKAAASFILTASEPTMRVYERDPLSGIRFDRALGSSFAITGSEATLYAAPFSFATALRAPAIEWYMGRTLVETGSVVTLRPTGRGAGSAELSVRGASGSAVFADHDLTISFGAEGGPGFFGL